MQKVSLRGLAEIAAHEAIILSPYKDSIGVWTIGIGHTKNAGPPNPLNERREFTIKEVIKIFKHDIRKFENRVQKAFTRPLTQEQFDAAVSFDFNTGGIHRASWVKHFNKGDEARAQKAFMLYPATGSGKIVWDKGSKIAIKEIMNAAAFENFKESPPQKSKAKLTISIITTIAYFRNGPCLLVGSNHNLDRRVFAMIFFIQKLKGWRAIIVNILLALLPILQLTEWSAILPTAWLPWYAVAIALINLYMRSITTSPLGKKI